MFALATRSWYASAAVLTPWLYYISSRIFRKSGDSTCTCCTSTMGDVKSPARSEPSSRSWRSDWAQQRTFAPPRGRSPTPTSRPARGLGVEVRHKSCSRVWARMSSCRVITPTTKQRQSCSSSWGVPPFKRRRYEASRGTIRAPIARLHKGPAPRVCRGTWRGVEGRRFQRRRSIPSKPDTARARATLQELTHGSLEARLDVVTAQSAHLREWLDTHPSSIVSESLGTSAGKFEESDTEFREVGL